MARIALVRDPRTGLAYFDILALSVLAPGVPVPAHDTGNYQPLSSPISLAMHPALRTGEERAGGAGQVGFVTLLQATWVRPGRSAARAGIGATRRHGCGYHPHRPRVSRKGSPRTAR